MSTTNPKSVPSERRSFLGFLGAVFFGLIATAMGFASGIYAVLPAFSSKNKKNASWQSLKSLEQIPNGISKQSLVIDTQTGWATSQKEEIVWVVKEDQAINVFSATCPHQGCKVNHQANEFVCLCHMSKWKADGVRSEGPTPRNLDKLDHRVTNNNLEVNYQNFKIGVSEKIPLA